jgi:hypothetical protein
MFQNSMTLPSFYSLMETGAVVKWYPSVETQDCGAPVAFLRELAVFDGFGCHCRPRPACF